MLFIKKKAGVRMMSGRQKVLPCKAKCLVTTDNKTSKTSGC